MTSLFLHSKVLGENPTICCLNVAPIRNLFPDIFFLPPLNGTPIYSVHTQEGHISRIILIIPSPPTTYPVVASGH